VVRLPELTANARDVLLNTAAPAAQKQSVVALQTPAAPQVVLDVAAAPEGGAGVSTPTVQVVLNPEATGSETPTAPLNIPQPTVQRLEAPRDVTGKVMYVMKEAPTGAATVQALAPVQEAEAPVPARTTTDALEMPALELGSAPELATNTQAQNAPAQPAVNTLQRFAEQLKQAQHNHVAQQVVVAVQPLLKGEGGSVRMTINPPELGRIEIHLKIEAGQVSGAIAATEPATVEHLARELPTLKQAFADAGLKLGEQGLSLMLNQNNSEQQRQPNPFEQHPQQHGRPAPAFEDAEGIDVQTITAANATRWVSPDRVLDREV
jgi:flagellar hook-length control protein FliK